MWSTGKAKKKQILWVGMKYFRQADYLMQENELMFAAAL